MITADGREATALTVSFEAIDSGATSQAMPLERHGRLHALRAFAPHLLSLVFPIVSLAFLWTGPHPWWLAPLFAIPGFLMLHLDTLPIAEARQPDARLPSWPYDVLIYLLTALHFVTVFSVCRMFSQQAIFSIDMLVLGVIVGGSAGLAIITAHELIHRRSAWQRFMGRLVLCTVLYEHFYTEHVRGHHRRVGTPDDPATARFGETYAQFWKRTIRGQFASAWRIEAGRLGDSNMRLFDLRLLRSRVVHGLVVQIALIVTIATVFGVSALAAFLYMAYVAVKRLEAVNYFEHWGLKRSGPRVQASDAWDTHSWLTYYALTGLSRHSDHHQNASRPYQQLQVCDSAPMLPAGYLAMVDMVFTRNDEFIRNATAELQRRKLGPFAADAEASHVAPANANAKATTASPRHFDRLWSAIPPRGQFIAYNLSIFLLVSLGGTIESGSTFTATLLHNVPILAAFILMLVFKGALSARLRVPEPIAMCIALALFVVCGGALSYIA